MGIDHPDEAVEISEWDSAEAREKMMRSEAMGTSAPLFELFAATATSATVVAQLHEGPALLDLAVISIGIVAALGLLGTSIKNSITYVTADI